MGSRRKTFGRVGATALVAIMLAGCSSSSVTFPPARSSAASAAPAGTGVHVAIPDESGAKASQPVASGAPRATAGSVTVDQITADYTYKAELIESIPSGEDVSIYWHGDSPTCTDSPTSWTTS